MWDIYVCFGNNLTFFGLGIESSWRILAWRPVLRTPPQFWPIIIFEARDGPSQ